jgi:hypothetical protein
MTNAFFSFPEPCNELQFDYAPGSALRAALEAELQGGPMTAQSADY